MDDLFGGLIVVTLVVMAAMLAAAAAVAVFVIGSTAGAVIGAFFGIGVFASSVWKSVTTRGKASRSPRDPEPAFELYILGQFKADISEALRQAWARMQEFRVKCEEFNDGLTETWQTPFGWGVLAGGTVAPIIGAVVAFLLITPFLIAAGVLIAGAWVLVGIFRGAERVRRTVRRTAYECPEDHERFPLPVYICPGCGAEHRNLVPGRWGILKRECKCEKVALPTMVLNGRQKVPQQCPSGHPMSGLIGFARPLRLALVAGPSAGKTTYLAAAVKQLEKLGDEKKLAVSVVPESRSQYDTLVDALDNGRLPAKTQITGNPALIAEVQGGKRSRVMHAYDVAGEHYGDASGVSQLRFLEVPSGVILLIDPFSIRRVSEEHADELAGNEAVVQPSAEDPMRPVERTISALVEGGADPSKIPVAVVIGKADAFGIGGEIEQLRAAGGADAPRLWLEQQGAGNLVRSIEQEFGEVGWFACSALGRMPEPNTATRAFEPAGAIEPMLWLLERNGIKPSAKPFEASKTAEKLTGASAADFPPIGSGGWAWRAGISGAIVTALLGVMAFGAVQLVPEDLGGSSGSGPSTATAATGSSAPSTGPTGPTGSSGGSSLSRQDRILIRNGYPADSAGQMESDMERVLLDFHQAVLRGDYRGAWNEMSQRKQEQKEAEEGFSAWSKAQATLRPYLKPGGLNARIEKLEGDGVARVYVGGMEWTDPTSRCGQWVGITWMKYERGQWTYDPGYSTTPQREKEWEARFAELLGANC